MRHVFRFAALLAGACLVAACTGDARNTAEASQEAPESNAPVPVSEERQRLAQELVILTGPPDLRDRFEAILISSATATAADQARRRSIEIDGSTEATAELLDAEARARVAGHADALFTAMARVYARLFTEEELEAMLAFYRSEAGAKMTALGDEINDGVGHEISQTAAKLELELLDLLAARAESENRE